jgi:hypothetical protein
MSGCRWREVAKLVRTRRSNKIVEVFPPVFYCQELGGVMNKLFVNIPHFLPDFNLLFAVLERGTLSGEFARNSKV